MSQNDSVNITNIVANSLVNSFFKDSPQDYRSFAKSCLMELQLAKPEMFNSFIEIGKWTQLSDFPGDLDDVTPCTPSPFDCGQKPRTTISYSSSCDDAPIIHLEYPGNLVSPPNSPLMDLSTEESSNDSVLFEPTPSPPHSQHSQLLVECPDDSVPPSIIAENLTLPTIPQLVDSFEPSSECLPRKVLLPAGKKFKHQLNSTSTNVDVHPSFYLESKVIPQITCTSPKMGKFRSVKPKVTDHFPTIRKSRNFPTSTSRRTIVPVEVAPIKSTDDDVMFS